MDINTAKQITRTKLAELGLHGFSVGETPHKVTAGWCYTFQWSSMPQFRKGKILLSTMLIPLMSDEDAMDTILHEIGHAMTNPKLKDHGPEWKANTRSIGGSGVRTYNPKVLDIDYRYTGLCPNGHTSNQHRLTWSAKHNRSCGKCDSSYNTDFMYNWYDRGELVHENFAVAFSTS